MAAGSVSLYVVWLGESAYRQAAELARELRFKNAVVELAADDVKLKKALETASRRLARYVLIVGEQELVRGKYTLRDMYGGTQKTVTKEELFEQFTGEQSAEKRLVADPALPDEKEYRTR